VVPIAGAITPRYMHFLINLKNTPVYMIQGVHDPIFPIKLSRRVNKILQDMKYSAVYKEHQKTGLAHGGHFLPEEEVPSLVQWLKEQRRPLNPQVVRMTREANHLAHIHWLKAIKGV
jgi:predicted esterase